MRKAIMRKAIDKTPSSPIAPPPTPDIIAGDCFSELPKIAKGSVHLVVTDPPYYLDGLCDEWKKGNKVTTKGVIGKLPVGMKFDPRQGVRLQEFIGRVGELINPLMFPGAYSVFFSSPRLAHRTAIGLEDAGFEIRDLLAWNFGNRSQFKAFSQNHFVDRMDISDAKKKGIKKNLGGRVTPQLRPQFEAMILAQKPKEGTFVDNWIKYKTGLISPNASLDGRCPSTVIKADKQEKEVYNTHLTVKPVLLVKHLIELLSIKGQTVLDPFLGSGTTAIAAQKTMRKCIGIEKNLEYVEITKKRLEELSWGE